MLSFMKAKEWLLLAVFTGFVLLQVLLALRMPEYMSGITAVIQGGSGRRVHRAGLLRCGDADARGGRGKDHLVLPSGDE